MSRRPKRKKSGPRGAARLGPFGADVRIRWDEHHAGDRAVQRLYVLGLDDDEIEGLIRQPLTKRRDEPDPDRPGRIRRWSLTPDVCRDGRRHELLFVFVVAAVRTDVDPGEVLMITVIDKGPTA